MLYKFTLRVQIALVNFYRIAKQMRKWIRFWVKKYTWLDNRMMASMVCRADGPKKNLQYTEYITEQYRSRILLN